MRLVGHLLRFYSYAFETVLCGAGLLLGVFTLASSNVDVGVPWLPWTGATQMRWIAGLSIAGLISVALAIFGIVRTILFLFSAVVVAVLVRGLLSPQYTFSGLGEARNAVLLILGALLAMVGAYPGLMKRHSPGRGRRA